MLQQLCRSSRVRSIESYSLRAVLVLFIIILPGSCWIRVHESPALSETLAGSRTGAGAGSRSRSRSRKLPLLLLHGCRISDVHSAHAVNGYVVGRVFF